MVRPSASIAAVRALFMVKTLLLGLRTLRKRRRSSNDGMLPPRSNLMDTEPHGGTSYCDADQKERDRRKPASLKPSRCRREIPSENKSG